MRYSIVILACVGCAAPPPARDVAVLDVQRECSESESCYCRLRGELQLEQILRSAEVALQTDDGVARLSARPALGDCALFRAERPAGNTVASYRVVISVREGTLMDFAAGVVPARVVILLDDQDPPAWRGDSEVMALPGASSQEFVVTADGGPFHRGVWRLNLRLAGERVESRLVAR
jgi:hypothetical protein